MAVFTSKSVKRNFPATMESQVADKDYYVDAEGNLVDEGDEKAAFLVAAKGSEVAKDVAEKYGIEVGEQSPEAPDEESAPEPDSKKSAAPAANKSVKPAANKKGAK